MATRTARTAWNGGLLDGSGEVELSSSKLGTFAVSWPRRIGDDAEAVTSPEELLAAAHSSCFAMQLSGEIAQAGGTPHALHVTAEATFARDGDGWSITGIAITVEGEVEGLDESGFRTAAEAAKDNCPVSRALAVDISVTATLVR
ncbi:MAG: lipoyl-dependent peroxiredoxin [Microbacteriaceae bacterium]|nr:lipoyl-dependent peroxiredoxin [Microbacteriaceae bacterium]